MKFTVFLVLTGVVLALIAAPSVKSTIVKRTVAGHNPAPAYAPGAQLLPGGRKSLTVLPQNVATYAGSTVTLSCESGVVPPASRIQWYEYSSGNELLVSDNLDITPGHPNSDRYSIRSSNDNEYYLEIRNVVLSDGGTYLCSDRMSGPPDSFTGQAELIVIESTMNCTTLVASNGIVMELQNYTNECEIRYRGGFAPKLTWTGPEPYRGPVDITTETDVYTGIGYTVLRSFDTRAYAVVSAFQDLGELPDGIANNIPTFTERFQFDQMYVFWGPQNLYAEPIQPSYVVGDVITCYADAFPTAFYQWQNMATLEIFYSQLITVTTNLVGSNTRFRCQAQNVIQGFLYSQNIFIDVLVPAPTTTTTVAPTTTPPLDAPCTNLTGWWLSASPYAELFLNVTTDGRVVGGMRNFTDQYTVEVAGRTRMSDYAYIGLTLIYPFNKGLLGLTGECHRCSGVEVIFTETIWRSFTDSAGCGDGGTPGPSTAFEFRRWDGGLTAGR